MLVPLALTTGVNQSRLNPYLIIINLIGLTSAKGHFRTDLYLYD